MFRLTFALLCAVFALSLLEPTVARKSLGRHSYPSSRGGLSGGGGSHSYPSSGGLSGHGSHGYPSSGGLSGGGNRGYPSSSGGSHTVPSSGGSHGYPSSGGLSGNGRGYPASNTNAHPSNTHGYPASSGLGGSGSHSTPGHTTNVHHHYHYSPPSQIQYTPRGGAPASYPVYHGTPPNYVYQYKDSGSKYSSLLAGLALFNLGALGGYALGHHNSGGSGSSGTYKQQPGEVCKFGIKKDDGDYEETRIDCQLISSFIIAEDAKQNAQNNNVTTITTTTTNVTTTNMTDTPGTAAPVAAPTDALSMFPNGTLVSANETAVNGTVLSQSANETVASATAAVANTATSDSQAAANSDSSFMTVTTTTTNTTVTNALDVKGPPVQVTDGMKCYVIRNTKLSTMRKTVPCGLLQTYSEKSLKKNSASKIAPTLSIFTVIAVFLFQY